MTNQASLDPRSKHISLGYTPEIPEIASGVNLTFSLPQSPDIQSTFKFARIFDILCFTAPKSCDPEREKLRAMSKAARANKAYRSPDSNRMYHHTIPAEKTVGDIAVDLYFDLPSEVNWIDSRTACN